MKARSVTAERSSAIPIFELILASAIWGFAFVAQRKGNESLHPLFFNALRFGIGSLFLLTLIQIKAPKARPKLKADLLLLGCILFIASALQQIGLLWTSAGSGGFITGLYVVFIPIIGIFKKQKLSKLIIASIFLAVPGLWLINSGASVGATFGNLLVLISAIFWAMHVQYIDTIVQRYPSLWVAFSQYAICAVINFIVWLAGMLLKFIEPVTVHSLAANVSQAAIPVLYSGICSVGIAYTLQLHAQKKVAPTPAGIILCMEAVFALLGGWLLLNEQITWYSIGGAALLFTAMIVSTVPSTKPELAESSQL
jgi:drug/metabolite transporter (DMT)-like permease